MITFGIQIQIIKANNKVMREKDEMEAREEPDVVFRRRETKAI